MPGERHLPNIDPIIDHRPQRVWFALIAIAMVAGFALRLSAAQGALWLDEAWSASFARDVRTIPGIFWQINHDNNHHLNTLWLQWVGFDAHPAWQRMLSILSGTAAIGVAGAIGWRRSAATGAIAAALFALSPVMVTYGSEARGYAPMMLALLVAILLVDRWLDSPDRATSPRAIAITVALGCLAQLTMIFGLAAILGWAALREWQRIGLKPAIVSVTRLLGPALIAAAVVVAINFAPMLAGRRYEIGHYTPYDLHALIAGLEILSDSLFALSIGIWGLAALVVLAAMLPWMRSRRELYVLALAAFPLAVALLQIGNSGNPRYFLTVAVVALLLVGDVLGGMWPRRGALRWTAIALIAVVAAASLRADIELIRNQRGDVARAIEEAERIRPTGTTMRVESPRAGAVLKAAAAHRGYRIDLLKQDCPPAALVFIDRDGNAPFPASVVQCGIPYRVAAEGRTTGLSGNHWRLYAAMR